jgi:hypothetical protein
MLTRLLIRIDLWHARLTLLRVPLHEDYYSELFTYIKNRETELAFLTERTAL